MNFKEIISKLESPYIDLGFISTECETIARLDLTSDEHDLITDRIFQKCSIHSRMGLIVDGTNCKVDLKLVIALFDLSKIFENKILQGVASQLLENYISNFDFKRNGFSNAPLNLDDYLELSNGTKSLGLNPEWGNELKSDLRALIILYGKYPNIKLHNFLLNLPTNFNRWCANLDDYTNCIRDLFSNIGLNDTGQSLVNIGEEVILKTNPKFAKEIIARPFKRTLSFIHFTVSQVNIDRFFDKLAILSLAEYVDCIGDFVDGCEQYLSLDICAKMKELYRYERECWELFCSIENMQLELRKELIHEKQKQIFFNSTKKDFFKFNLSISPAIRFIETQWLWTQNAAWDTEVNLPSQQLIAPITNVLNCIVISSFSKRGFYEYVINDWDEKLLDFFRSEPSIDVNYQHFSKSFSLLNTQEKSRLFNTTREFIEKLVDRNILLIENKVE